jgi:DNA-directed RNA polymerase specialized sigma24 family protein
MSPDPAAAASGPPPRADPSVERTELYNRVFDFLRSAARRFLTPSLRRDLDSEDVAQSVLRRACPEVEEHANGRLAEDNLRAFLFVVVRNRVFEAARRPGARAGERQQGEDGLHGVAAHDAAPDQLTALRECYVKIDRRLDHGERDLSERRARGRPWDEIAEAVGEPQERLRKRLSDAWQRVARQLSDLWDDAVTAEWVREVHAWGVHDEEDRCERPAAQ